VLVCDAVIPETGGFCEGAGKGGLEILEILIDLPQVDLIY